MAGSRLNPVLFSPSYPSPHKQQDRNSRPPSTQSSALMRLSPLPRNGNPVTLRCTSVLSATQQCSVSDLTGQRCCLHIKHRVQISAASWHTNRAGVGSTQKITGRDIHTSAVDIRYTAAQAKHVRKLLSTILGINEENVSQFLDSWRDKIRSLLNPKETSMKPERRISKYFPQRSRFNASQY